MEELLTIAIPVYGRTDYFKEVIDCILNQTVKCKVLVIDNASPHDEFEKIITELNNPLFTYIKNDENVGVTLNMNKCINTVTTPWMTILHDDDLLHKKFVEFTQEILTKRYTNIDGFMVGNYVGESCDKLNDDITLTDNIKLINPIGFLFKNMTPFPGVVFRTKVGQKLKGFNHDFYPIADLDFWYRLASVSKIAYVDQKLSFYRISAQQSTNDLLHNMIDKNLEYREKIQNELSVNNPITKLAIRKTSTHFIKFYTDKYENYGGPKLNEFEYNITHHWPLNKFLNRHINKKSFSKIKAV